MSELLNIRNLTVKYGANTVIEELNMTVHVGEKYCVFGKNGAGKSTLLKSIVGIKQSYSGSILFEGQSINQLSLSDRLGLGIGYLMQHEAVFPRLKVKDHIKLAAALSNDTPLNEIWDEIDAALPQISNGKNILAGQLSGGQQRQLALAVLIAQGANKLWVLDEPSAGVAKQSLDVIAQFITTYTAKHNIACILVEQNQFFGKQISNRIFNL